MDQSVARQPQAKVPLELLEILKQSLVHKATISEQSDKLTGR